MIPWIAVLILAVLLLLGQVRLEGGGTYSEAGMCAWLKIGPVKLRLLPRRTEAETNKSPKKKKREKEKPSSPEETAKKEPFLTRRGLFRLGKSLLPLALEAAGQLPRKIRVDVLHLRLLVGTPDPADTALQYGQVCALLGAVWPLLTQNLKVLDGTAHVEADFDRDSPAFSGEASLSMTVGQLVLFGVYFGLRALKKLLAVRREDKALRQQRKAA